MGRVVLERGLYMKNFMSNIKVKLVVAFIIFLIVPANTYWITYPILLPKDTVEHEILHGIEQNVSLLNSSIDSTLQPKIFDMDYFSQTINANIYQDENSPELRKEFDLIY